MPTMLDIVRLVSDHRDWIVTGAAFLLLAACVLMAGRLFRDIEGEMR